MRKAAMAAGGCAIALFAAVPLHVRLGNHDLPVGAATALQYGLAALGLAVALWISLAIGDRRRLPLAEGLVALVAAAVLNHVLLFDLVFEGVLDGGPAALATRTAGSYLATLLYVAAWAGAVR